MIPLYKYIVEIRKYQLNRSECLVEWIKYTVYIFINSVKGTMSMISTFECFVILVKTFIKTTQIRFI